MTDKDESWNDAKCHWCETVHPVDYLCPEAGEVLKKLLEQGASYDAPTIELEDAVDENVEGILCQALAVKAFYTLTLGVYRPGIAVQPILLDGSHGKPFLMIDDERNIKRAGQLFQDMCALAIRRAGKAARDAFKSRDLGRTNS
jgi:hypothetical protein